MPVSLKAKLNQQSAKKAARTLQQIFSKIERQAKREALSKAARYMVKQVKQNVKVDQGHLRRAIKFRIRTYKKSENIVAFIGPDRNYKGVDEKGRLVEPVKYAIPQEFGSVNQAGHPYMRPGFDSGKSGAFKIYKDEIVKAVVHVAKRFNKRANAK